MANAILNRIVDLQFSCLSAVLYVSPWFRTSQGLLQRFLQQKTLPDQAIAADGKALVDVNVLAGFGISKIYTWMHADTRHYSHHYDNITVHELKLPDGELLEPGPSNIINRLH